ncbi:MAG: hypothetical protein E6J90_38660 [Deltaproteobacteria bacterium]|nr:MAG: hypothetical protein E6J90_38660 [Deltaproteobacteria bacterium]
MTAVTFTGLSSGIDTASLVTQLVAAERAPANNLTGRQSDLATQKTIVGNLSSALAALGTAVRGLDLPGEVQPRKATASDGHVTAAASSGALATVHAVRVEQLARSQITSSRTFDSAGPGVLGDGSVTITTGTKTATISYTGADSLADIAARINGAGVAASASVLFDGTSYRLVVASTGTGTAAAAQFADDGDGLALSDPDNIKVHARDAKAEIDGVEVTRASNVIADAVPGVTFTLVSPHAAADASSSVSVALDTDGLHGKLAAIVSAYNTVNAALHAQLDYTGTQKGTNTLFGDATLRQLQGALGSIMTSSYGPAASDASEAERAATGTTLGAIGLSRDKTGALTLDTAMTDAYTRGGDGILAGKTAGLTARSTALQGTIDQINTRADALKTQLETQFTALETAMSQLKSQSSYLSSILG